MFNIIMLPQDLNKSFDIYTTVKGEKIKTVKFGSVCEDKKTEQLSINMNGAWSITADTDILVPQHLYITNSEEIKEGDWVVTLGGHLDKVIRLHNYSIVTKIQGVFNDTTSYKKIILTTDLDLINDGVQAIEDDFLEWFVKNPSCEQIKVEGHIYKGQYETEYKIIIPKEEPKDLFEWIDKEGLPATKRILAELKAMNAKQETSTIDDLKDIYIHLDKMNSRHQKEEAVEETAKNALGLPDPILGKVIIE